VAPPCRIGNALDDFSAPSGCCGFRGVGTAAANRVLELCHIANKSKKPYIYQRIDVENSSV
jgi:hypothetical protein